MTRVRVWSAGVRVLHWSLVVGVAAAWATGSSTSLWHEVLGYALGALVLLRVGLGLHGGRYTRFSHFVRGPRATGAYLRAARAGHAPRHLGHNPLGGWMILTLLAAVALLTITGALYTTDWLWGYAWLANLHEALAWGLLALIVLHVAGAVFTGRRHGENLVRAMLDGRKRAPGPGDVD